MRTINRAIKKFLRWPGYGNETKEGEMKKAFVEVVYSNSSGSMAGASCGILNRADVVEVEANDIQEAMKEAREKYKDHHFTTIKGVNFLRWA